MQRILITLISVTIIALLACSESTPAPEGAETPTPTQAAAPAPKETPPKGPTPAPAATPASTSTPVTTAIPTQTTAPTVEPQPGEQVFIAVDYGLSEAELTCFSESGDPAGLARALNAPGSATQEQQGKLLDCLEDETVGRLFLAGFVGDPGHLSLETSTCIQAAFKEINPRAVMTAGIEGNPGAAMAGSMTAFSVTQACLNDEEWEAQASQTGMSPAERQGLQCLMRELGGPEEMAAAMTAASQGDLTTLSTAEMACGLNMGTGPPPKPEPIKAASTPTPATTTPQAEAPAPTKAPEPANMLVINVASVQPGIPEYDRGDWKHWADYDKDCQNIRHEVLIAESLVPVEFKTGNECQVQAGRWFGAFAGRHLENAGYMDVDHMVPLQNAHLSGGWEWASAKKEEYANYLKDPDHLIAVSSRANRSKGARGPEDWKPSDETYWCRYATDWTEIKAEWDLTMTQPEAEAVAEMLDTCENPPEVEVQDVLEPRTGVDKPESPGPVYESCEEAAAAGETRAQGSSGNGRGYPKEVVPSARDGDGDGVVCEK